MKTKILIVPLLFCTLGYGQGKFFGGNGDGFSSAALGNIVLPLQVIDFSVLKNGNEVKAFLKISDEEACKVVLEKSEDGFLFSGAASLGNGTQTIPGKDFSFIGHLTTEKTVYYRAKIINCASSSIYSKTISVTNDVSQNQFRYNRANRNLQYTVKQNGLMQLINSSGQIIYKANLAAGSGIINFPITAPGIYLLRFSNEKVIKIFVQ